ncbi:MAG: prepilin-type N-terminal cleavage/methylation domain-containing protein [Planctomycetota bacterium]|nr:prepilin-type N-terminal cleavage/methylation domain-containing protein [Planctomycetota bacterium]
MRCERYYRRGVTLLELLVVVFILAILLAVAIPVFTPSQQEESLREAARSVYAALGMARNRAIENGRPYGIRFDPLRGTVHGSAQLSFVGVPPPYAGDYSASRMRIISVNPIETSTNGEFRSQWIVQAGQFILNNNAYPDDLAFGIRPGDTLKLNCQGHVYRILHIEETGNDWKLTVGSKTVTSWPRTYLDPDKGDELKGGPEYGYQFFRQPVETSAVPIQLPQGAVVDIEGSGIGGGLFDGSRVNPIVVMFSPNGLVDVLYHNDAPMGQKLGDPLHFLIGKPGSYRRDNLVDLQNLWVSVNYQTGLITVAPMTVLYDEDRNPRDPDTNSEVDIRALRHRARSGESLRG